MSLMSGFARYGDEYGGPTDWRSRVNHQEFSHQGFEYRSLPNFFVDKEFALAVFTIARMVVETFEIGKPLEVTADASNVENFKNLVGFEDNSMLVKRFLEWTKSGSLNKTPALMSLFGKKFQKDKECDVEIVFANDPEGFLGIKSFVMYNPQKLFNRIVIYSTQRGYIKLSSEVPTLQSYLMKTKGRQCAISPPTAEFRTKYVVGKTLCIGVPEPILGELARESHGSRNRIKMFVQELVKNI